MYQGRRSSERLDDECWNDEEDDVEGEVAVDFVRSNRCVGKHELAPELRVLPQQKVSMAGISWVGEEAGRMP